ncbi:MAG: phosphate ABC transporter permease PstA [Bdellovibrionales bacterium]|nr:phosphate ABC transporter permease PstA [Bdellovibrionales bacterium]
MTTKERRMKQDMLFRWCCRIVTFMALGVLLVLLSHIFSQGFKWLSWDFINSYPSRFADQAGIKSAVWGSIWVISFTAIFSVPFGVATAFFLEEYSNSNSKFVRLLQINIANLAGMPSIIYGLLGLTLFARGIGLGGSVLTGSLTLSLLILPVIVIASQEAIKAVPNSIRYGAYAMGARKWQVIVGQVLPAALPGIMTGVILSLSRAIGETAPLIIIGALSYVAFTPLGPFDDFTVLPVQIYNWAGRPQEEFHEIASAGIIVLLAVLFTMNLVAIMIRQKFQKYRM